MYAWNYPNIYKSNNNNKNYLKQLDANNSEHEL